MRANCFNLKYLLTVIVLRQYLNRLEKKKFDIIVSSIVLMKRHLNIWYKYRAYSYAPIVHYCQMYELDIESYMSA